MKKTFRKLTAYSSVVIIIDYENLCATYTKSKDGDIFTDEMHFKTSKGIDEYQLILKDAGYKLCSE